MYSAQLLTMSGDESDDAHSTTMREIADELKDVSISTKETYREEYSKSIEISQEYRHFRLRTVLRALKYKRKSKTMVEQKKKMKGLSREIIKMSFERNHFFWAVGIVAAVLCGCFFPLMPIINAQAVTGFIDGLNLTKCSETYFDYVCSAPALAADFCDTDGGTFPAEVLPPGVESLLFFCDPSFDDLR